MGEEDDKDEAEQGVAYAVRLLSVSLEETSRRD